MSSFDDYDVLSNLGSDSCFYKVKNKATAELCIWRAINVGSFTEQQLKLLLRAISDEKQIKHHNSVQVYSHILNNTTLYVVTKFYKYGNLKNIIELCIKRNEILSEAFLWRLLYSTVCVLKLRDSSGTVNLESIFMDADFVIKVYHLDIASRPCSTTKCISSVGTILYQLCNLQLKLSKIKFPITIPKYYSDDLLNIITLLLKDSKKINFDRVLCHPSVLLNSVSHQNEVFTSKPHIGSANTTESNSHSCKCNEVNYREQLEYLKNKDASLKSLEKKLNEKESILRKREKMLLVMENSIKDKMRQADMYFKKVQQTNSNNTAFNRKMTYEELDTTLSAAECDESVVLPTSTKINLNGIKTSNFSRSLSERRIRFKGHSPLKDICNISRSVTTEKLHTNQTMDCVKNSKCKKRVGFSELNQRKSKLFDEKMCGKENHEIQIKNECRPISWSDEAKRQAFDMLRVLNAAETGQGFVDMKHTYL